MGNIEILALCVGIAGLLGIILAAIVLVRYLNYRRELRLIEQGLAPPRGDGKETLRWGILLTALGLALGIGLYPLGSLFPGQYPLNFGPWMLLALLPLFFGLALVLIHLVTGDKRGQ